MRLLALAIGPAGPAVAVLGGAAEGVERHAPGGRAETLAPLAAEALAVSGLRFADLEALAVQTGPGSFTATRAAVAAARALALATGLPVHALSALEVAAEAVRETLLGPFLALAPAGRGTLAAQPFAAGAVAAGPPLLLDAARASAETAGVAVVTIDLDGWEGSAVARLTSSVLALARAAAGRHGRGIAPLPGRAVRPLYLRPPDARPEAGRPLVAAS